MLLVGALDTGIKLDNPIMTTDVTVLKYITKHFLIVDI